MKKIVILLSAFAMAFTVPAMAAETTGSISVTLSADNRAVDVSDGTFGLYRVADITEAENNDYVYEYTDGFRECGYELDLSDAGLPGSLFAWAEGEGVPAVAEAVPENGRLSFDDIPPGLYLVAQSEASSGYYAASPFLVSVPLYENGSYTFSVDASPKMEPLKEDTGVQAVVERLTVCLEDLETGEPLEGLFTLTDGGGRYASVASDSAVSGLFAVKAYASDAGNVVWTDEETCFTLPEDGLTFAGMGEGTYVITEVSQQGGYLPPGESITVAVDSEGYARIASCPEYEGMPLAEASGEAWNGVVTVKNVPEGASGDTAGTVTDVSEEGGGASPDVSGDTGASGDTADEAGGAKTGDATSALGLSLIAAAMALTAVAVAVRRRSYR